MSTLVPLDVNVDGDCWTEFSNFWTESIPQFFTETLPQAFQDAWDATAKWVEECVMPFFKDCENWFSENADWLWPVAVAFVAGAALAVGVALCCFCGQSEEGRDSSEEAKSLAGRATTPDLTRSELELADKKA